MPKKLTLIGLAFVLAAAVACSGDSARPPAAPTSVPVTDSTAAADGSTLKVTAPVPTTPADGATNVVLRPVLVVTNATGVYVPAGSLFYRFEFTNAAGEVVWAPGLVGAGTSGTTSLQIPLSLSLNTVYRWRARAEYGTTIGPWSGWVSFRTQPGPTPPTVSSPANGAVAASLAPTLIVNTSEVPPGFALSDIIYRFVVEAPDGTPVIDATVPATETTTSYTVAPNVLAPTTTYRWRVRGEIGSALGNWSPYWTFVTPDRPPDPFEMPGYIRPNELWDPLTKGVSVGEAVNMEFVPGQGARTISNESRITYNLLQTLQAGEFSFYVYNLNPLSAGDKTKLMSMQEGGGDITTNDYRFTVEKRGVAYISPGQVRIRIINGDAEDHGSIHDSVPTVPPLVRAQWYFVRLTWGNNTSTFQIRQTDPNGPVVANIVVNYPGRQYRPVPHVAHIGAPVGRAGSQDASVSNMTVKGVFIGGVGAVRPSALGGGIVGDIQ